MYQSNLILSEKLKKRKFLLGTHVTCGEMQLAEMISQSGVDYIWMDTEHTALTKQDVMQQLIAMSAADIPVFVRVPKTEWAEAKPILDLGASGIIFPMIRTVEDVEYAIACCTYPPYGIRGYGPRRAARFGLDSAAGYISEDADKVYKLIQIETREAVENLDEICRVSGISALIIGPMDLSGAYHHLGEDNHPEMLGIYRRIAETGRKAGIPVMVSTGAHTVENIRKWVDMGVNLVTVGNEFGYILSGLRETIRNAETVERM